MVQSKNIIWSLGTLAKINYFRRNINLVYPHLLILAQIKLKLASFKQLNQFI